MVKFRERNGLKHIVSDNELASFAWGAYFANRSSIFINRVEYLVNIERRANLVFSDNRQSGYGNWVIFESANKIYVFSEERLKVARKEYALTEQCYCFTDEAFMAVV